MKEIMFIATGGTIASKKTRGGLTPQISPKEMLSYIPEINEVCKVTTKQLFNLDSSNIEPVHWIKLTEYIESVYDSYDGFVITHGTDTMAYTGAALSYMIQNSTKPIVITGSQKPINLDVTDAKTNLLDSFLYASDDASQGVTIIFDGKVIAGTRAKKVRSKSYNAFSSIDFPSLAVIQDRRIMRYIPMLPYEKPVKFYTSMDEKVFLLKLTPGIRPEILDLVFEKYDGIIIESFGVGGIPISIRENFQNLVKKYPDKLIVMSTQVTHEGSDMTVYEVGHDIKSSCNVLESYDMTPESVVAKTMWILGNKSDKLEKAFYTPVNFDSVWGVKE